MNTIKNKFGKTISIGDVFYIKRDFSTMADKCEVIGFTTTKVIVKPVASETEQKFNINSLQRNSYYLSTVK